MCNKQGKKAYIVLPDGTKMILEVHTDREGKNPVLRLYENIPEKNDRDYLYPDGRFRDNSYRSSSAHIRCNDGDGKWNVA